MEDFLKKLGIGFLAIIIVSMIAFLSGTIVWLIWPVAIPSVFPGLVATGTISGKISWWVAVCLTWICGILIKSSNTNYKNND